MDVNGMLISLIVLYIDVLPFTQVILSDFTMQYETLDSSNEYPSGGSGSIESKSPEFFHQLKRWTLVFLDDKRHQASAKMMFTEYILLSASLVYRQ